MKINLLLAKAFKFITFVLFTFMALVYFGVLLIVPLDIMTQIIRLFHGIGLPTVVAAALGIGGLAYLGLMVSRMPELYRLVIDIGVQLVSFGHAQIKRFDALIEGMQQVPAEDGAA
jgi:hypothetical protein